MREVDEGRLGGNVMAGESAGRAARRMREKAERLDRAAEMWERGAEGERRTAFALAELPRAEWTVLHDFPWPGRPRANIDHVAIGPPGVFVIDSKNWTGSITVTDGILRQNGRRRGATAAASGEAAVAIRHLLHTPPAVPVHGVLCFVRDAEIVGRVDDTLLCSTTNVGTMLQTRQPVLDPAARDLIVSRLAARLNRAPAPTAGKLTFGDRKTIARTNRERFETTRSSRRRKGKSSVVSSLLGAAVAIGFVGVVTAQPQMLSNISEVFVGFMTDDLGSDQPKDQISKEPKDQSRKDKPANERRSE
ncbi:NERD domain-containing protein [Nocardioides antri]|uniref:NERD domain-containing protein n=1 Tax=Nocardioides antri TaxID=2607659 RepID=A0A5B1LZJ1_9ACTN|nr:NERD domain-containing protein [Nocardioides antri]KAA1425866.1 NERD domain-containing protein [Nocardioides antri]